MDGTQTQHRKVIVVIKEWEKHANVTFEQSASPNAALIRIAFDDSDCCWSFVGLDVKKAVPSQPTMNLAWISKAETNITDTERGVILHEFGHTLGLGHEHQSPDRSGKITLKDGRSSHSQDNIRISPDALLQLS